MSANMSFLSQPEYSLRPDEGEEEEEEEDKKMTDRQWSDSPGLKKHFGLHQVLCSDK